MKNEEKHKRSRGDSIDGSIRGEYIAFLKAALKDAKAEAEKRVTEAEAEADKRIAEANKRIAEANKRIAEAKAEADKRIAEADKRIVEAKAEADKRIVEAKAEADKRIAEIKADAKERIAEIKTDAKERIVEAKADAKERIAEANELTKEAIAAGDKRLSQLFNFGHDMLGNLNRKSTPALERSQAAIRNKKQIAQGCQVRLLEKDREFGFNFLVGLEQELDVESNNAIEGLVRSTEVKSSVAVTKFKRIKNPKSLIKHCVDCVRDDCLHPTVFATFEKNKCTFSLVSFNPKEPVELTSLREYYSTMIAKTFRLYNSINVDIELCNELDELSIQILDCSPLLEKEYKRLADHK